MPKIVLFALNSSYTHTNLAVRCIRRQLAASGYDASILEFNLKDKRRRVLEALHAADADIYGFSTYIWNAREMLSFASSLRKLRSGAKIVFGGPEVSYDADELLRANPCIDCIITGEGERAFVQLAAMVEAGETLPRVMDGGIFDGFAEAGMVYDEADAGQRMVYYESSRGCPYRCAYCLSAMSGRVRVKSAEQTLSELMGFERMEGIRVVKFVDRTFNFDRERAKRIWRGLLDEKYTKKYHFEICADLLDEESFSLLAEFPAGKIQLEIGVQSVDSDTLRRVNRSPETARLLENIGRLHALGNMHIHADLIAGLPGEGIDGVARAFDALYGRCDMLQLGFLKLLRGSALRRDADTFGCVYSGEPPYEVLATDAIGFDELCLLHDIDELNERYGSGAFCRSMALVMSRCASPFGLYRSLAEGMRAEGLRIAELSQPRAYSLLYEYLHEGEDPALAEALSLDFLTHQKLSLPPFGGYELARIDGGIRRDFMCWADAAGVAYFAPALEAREGTRRYVIDRKNMRAFVQKDGKFVEI